MKKLLIVALGLGLAGQAQAKMDVSIESAKSLADAFVKFPANALLIEAKVVGKENSLQTTTQSLQKNVKALGSFQLGGSFNNKAGQTIKVTPVWLGKYKITLVNNVLNSVITFLQTILDINAIIRGDMLLPILNIAGEQSVLGPLDKMAENVTIFKNKLTEVSTTMSDIFDLMVMLDPEMQSAKDAVDEGSNVSRKK